MKKFLPEMYTRLIGDESEVLTEVELTAGRYIVLF